MRARLLDRDGNLLREVDAVGHEVCVPRYEPDRFYTDRYRIVRITDDGVREYQQYGEPVPSVLSHDEALAETLAWIWNVGREADS